MDDDVSTYDALEPGNIQLLHISSCTEEMVQCEMRHESMETADAYYALSYVWYTVLPDHSIP
jgi:hypothetical protein